MTNKEIIDAFLNGATRGKANNMRIDEHALNGDTRLVGYDRAVYALYSGPGKRREGPSVKVFTDWSNFSQTSATHISRIVSAARNHPEVEYIQDVGQPST